jgi:hypothetical protein
VALDEGTSRCGMGCAAGKTAIANARRNSTLWASTGVGDMFEREIGRHREEAGPLPK